MRMVLAAALLAAIASPALSAEFYIVQDTASKRCQVTDVKPTTPMLVIVGGKVYATRAEAEAASFTMSACKSQ